MKLSELLKDAKFPVKVRAKEWTDCEWFEVLAEAREMGTYPGFTNDGEVEWWSKDHDLGWEFYTEPKPKKKLYGWLVATNTFGVVNGTVRYNYAVTTDQYSIRLYENEHGIIGIRAPQFDCEVSG